MMKQTRAVDWQRALCRVAVPALLLAALPSYATPIAKFTGGNVSITLHDEACTLKAEITNLPKRAVWLEGGKEVEGCFGVIGAFGMVSLYFSDKTATAMPVQLFERVSAT